ncbi:MAG: hypothetical protein OEV89_00635 [Desulfobulbaceae bacterium]|nr:hypothetical protein [Desulfobulbaceae bacterium]HIJ89349.1 hypothetical protein [Deltaproteobacteria bacterium]
MNTYHIEMRSYRLLGWAWLVLCALGMIASFLDQLFLPAAGFALASLFGMHAVLNAGSFDIDMHGLTRTSSFGAWHIRWDEISRVEIGEVEGTLVLHGSNKRFILSSPGWWSAAEKDIAFDFVVKQLEARNIPPQPSRTAGYKIMKNTRVDH